MNKKENKIKIPKHVGLIMDGNRRWAKERNLPTFEGHREGYKKMKQSTDWFFSQGVEIISYFAFSTENWKRDEEEVNYLMKLIKTALIEESEEAKKKGYEIYISGRIDELPGDLPDACYEAISSTKGGNKGKINICLNYGGRAEIVDGIKSMIKNNVEVDQVHEGMVGKYLYNNQLSDPDIIVRTSGEHRLSGFLLWGAAYSEFLFFKKYWPEFEKIDAEKVIEKYNERMRRYGE